MITMTRDELLKKLASVKLVTVTFTKVDGTERVMNCTRNMSTIPVEFHPKNEDSVQSADNIRVFDLDVQGWRSFNFSTVKEVQ